MSTFVTSKLDQRVIENLNFYLGLDLEDSDHLPGGATVAEAISVMRTLEYTAREVVVALIQEGAMDQYLSWVEDIPVKQQEPTEDLTPVVHPQQDANHLVCIDCGSHTCTYQMLALETREPLEGDGICQACYMGFTLDTTRSQEEVEELNNTLVAV